MRIKVFLFIILLGISLNIYSKNKTTVAVLNFKNYGNSNVSSLSQSIPEAISSVLSSYKEINVVERTQLGKVINEIALSKTGLIDARTINRAGKILGAIVLIIGSVAGNKYNITVTIKAVRVTTGRVIDGRVIRGNIVDVTPMASSAARSMGAIISGKGVGNLTVSTTPVGSKVFIDGVNAGVSPIINYKLTEGSHAVSVVKEGYIEHSSTVRIKKGEFKTIKPYLLKKSELNRYELSFGGYLDIPFPYAQLDLGDTQLGFLANITFGYQFIYLLVKGEIGFGGIWHSQSFTAPINTVDMNYFNLNLQLHVNYIPFPTWKYIQPYIGGFLGGTVNWDNQPGNPETQDVNLLFNIGLTVGMNILPLGGVSIFVESRFYFFAPELTLPQYGQSGYFLTTETSKNFFLMGCTVGLGVRFNF
jgi:TolB-like protein